MSSAATTTTVCRYYTQAGKCFYGDECKFTHDGAAAAASAASAASTAAAAAAAPPPPQSSPKSSLAAGAKEWTPNSTPSSSGTTPVKYGSATLSGSTLNPNKTPFKPTGGGGGGGGLVNSGTTVPAAAAHAAPFYPATAWSAHAAEFIPSEAQSHHMQHHGVVESVDGVDEHHLLDSQYASLHSYGSSSGGGVGHGGVVVDDGRSLHAPTGSFVHPARYMGLEEFATSFQPVGAASTRPAIPPHATADITAIDERHAASLFMDEPLRARLTHWAHLQTARLQPDDTAFANLPLTLDHDRYHSLMPLPADMPPHGLESVYATSAGGSVSYKVTSAADGRSYVVKRLLSCRVSEDRARDLLQPWVDLASHYGSSSSPLSSQPSSARAWAAGPAHPSILAPRGAFLSKEFGDAPCTCVVYDFLPTAAALQPPQQDGVGLPVDAIWHYAVQVINALAAIHGAGLAAGDMLRAGRVLLTSDQRLHLSCNGVSDLLAGVPQTESEITLAQQADFHALGVLLLGWMGYADPLAAVASSSEQKDVFESLRPQLSRQFSGDLVDLVSHLFTVTGSDLTYLSVQVKVMHRAQAAYTTQLSHTDYLEAEMAKETQNGRLFRLMVKLGFITERPDSLGTGWSETGDRYLLSLFRDLVFHSVSSVDVPHIDWGHVVHQLNLLDAGSAEKLLLTSRNGESMLLVRYDELRRCVDESYEELRRKQREGLAEAGDESAMHAAAAQHAAHYAAAPTPSRARTGKPPHSRGMDK